MTMYMATWRGKGKLGDRQNVFLALFEKIRFAFED
jgi:hypothetical protein